MKTEAQPPTENEILKRYQDLAQEKLDAGLDRDQAAAAALRQAQKDLGEANIPASLHDLLSRPSTAFAQASTGSVLYTKRSVAHWKEKAAQAIGRPELKDAPDDELEAALVAHAQTRSEAS